MRRSWTTWMLHFPPQKEIKVCFTKPSAERLLTQTSLGRWVNSPQEKPSLKYKGKQPKPPKKLSVLHYIHQAFHLLSLFRAFISLRQNVEFSALCQERWMLKSKRKGTFLLFLLLMPVGGFKDFCNSFLCYMTMDRSLFLSQLVLVVREFSLKCNWKARGVWAFVLKLC